MVLKHGNHRTLMTTGFAQAPPAAPGEMVPAAQLQQISDGRFHQTACASSTHGVDYVKLKVFSFDVRPESLRGVLFSAADLQARFP